MACARGKTVFFSLCEIYRPDPSHGEVRFKRSERVHNGRVCQAANHGGLIQQLADFLADQGVAFLCTVDRNGQCAVNHRGGQRGFISVNAIQDEACLLLPDYAGNGALEAVGNIWETRRAAVFVPDPEPGYGVCVSGPAGIFDGEVLQTEPFVNFPGAQRVLAIYPEYFQVQSWNDDLGPLRRWSFLSIPTTPGDVLTGTCRTRGLLE